MPKIRVVVADDHREVIDRVRQTLDDRFEVVDAVENGQQAIDAVRRLDPDVLVIDIAMPVLNGLEATRRMRNLSCPTKVVILTVHEDRELAEAALTAGALAYVTKARLVKDLVLAINQALQGNTFVSPGVVKAKPTGGKGRR